MVFSYKLLTRHYSLRLHYKASERVTIASEANSLGLKFNSVPLNSPEIFNIKVMSYATLLTLELASVVSSISDFSHHSCLMIGARSASMVFLFVLFFLI